MLWRDLLHLAFGSLRAHRLRAGLTILGIAIGIGAVVLLTSIGEGIHRFVLTEFMQFGTNIVAITPGRTSTHGVPGAILGTIRPLTLEDAETLRKVPRVVAVVPALQGNALVEAGRRGRRATVIGTGPEMPDVFHFGLAAGDFLPEEDDLSAARPFAVLGSKLRSELFGDDNPLGQRIRIGGNRYRVIGTLQSKGEFLGTDLDDAIYIPAARALELFNREGLMEIDLLYAAGASVDTVVAAAKRILIARHGREDFTIITQEKMLEVLSSILGILTFAVGALGGISLCVGGVGILTIMTINVRERTAEIGLLRALGAERSAVLRLFLAESAALAAVGGACGLAVGAAGGWALEASVPGLPVHLAWPFALLAELLAVAVGLGAGILPARHAATLDAVEALRAE